MSHSFRNVILITADEMRADAAGFMGNQDCRTPHLDNLASRGAVFERHFTVHGKCVPSRIAMLTGRYAHTDAIRTVNPTNHLPKGDPNLMEFLRSQGYETAVFGLNHVWDDEWFYAHNRKSAGAVDYHSFTEGYFDDLAKRQIPAPPAPPNGPSPLEELMEIDYGGRREKWVEGFSDLNRADQAIRYLETIRDRGRPFYMQVNFSKPHPPYCIHEPWYSMYDRSSIRPYPHDLPANAILHLRKQRELRLGNNISAAALRELQAVYYGSVSFVDDCIGRLLQTVDSENLWADTLILFCSDHGDFAGQYGINEKWDTAMQDCILHVPMIVAGPGLPSGQRVTGLTEHVDVPDTVLDYLGLSSDERWVRHGQSMLPALAGHGGKEAVFADGGHEGPMRARFNTPTRQESKGRPVKSTGGKQLVYHECPESMARVKMIRTERWKLAIRETGGNELFDLATDPHEMHNRYGDPSLDGIVLELQRRLIEWCLRTDQDRPFQDRVGA